MKVWAPAIRMPDNNDSASRSCLTGFFIVNLPGTLSRKAFCRKLRGFSLKRKAKWGVQPLIDTDKHGFEQQRNQGAKRRFAKMQLLIKSPNLFMNVNDEWLDPPAPLGKRQQNQ